MSGHAKATLYVLDGIAVRTINLSIPKTTQALLAARNKPAWAHYLLGIRKILEGIGNR